MKWGTLRGRAAESNESSILELSRTGVGLDSGRTQGPGTILQPIDGVFV